MKILSILLVFLLIIFQGFTVIGSVQNKIGDSKNPENTFCGAEWYQTYGSPLCDWGDYVQQTDDGGYILTGVSFSLDGNAQSYVQLIKTDAYGNKEWNQTYSKSGLDYGLVVLQTHDNDGYIILAYADNEHHIWLIKTDTKGNVEWDKTFPGKGFTRGNDILQTNDGGYVIVGYNSDTIFAPGYDVWLIKVNALGEMEWNQTYDSPYYDEGFGVKQTPDGGYIIAGMKLQDLSGWMSLYLIKTDSYGSMEWNQQILRGEQDDYGYCIEKTSDGNYAVVGSALFKIDPDGNLLWDQPIEGRSLKETPDGGYIIVGTEQQWEGGEYGFDDLKLVKTDKDGVIEWKEYLGGPETDRGNCVQLTKDGGYIIIGRTDSFSPGEFDDDIWLIKVGKELTLKINNVKGPFGIKATVKNIGTQDMYNLNWSIYLSGKLFPWETVFLGKQKRGSIDILKAGDSIEIKSEKIFGFGPGVIQVSVGIIVHTVDCFMIGPYIIIKK